MRSYANVCLETVVANCAAVRDAAGAEVMAVVKADAFGHGAVPVTRTLAATGVKRFAVASLEEGVELRKAGIEAEILLLYGLLPGEEGEAREWRLTPALGDERQLTAWAAEARRAGQRLSCHVQFDTGMSRLGFATEDAPRVAEALAAARELHVAGISTHFASAERFGPERAAEDQYREFLAVVLAARERGLTDAVTHVANTAAAAYRTEWAAPLARTGLALYGYVPDGDGAPDPAIDVRPALEWRAQVLAVRTVPKGGRVGYGGTFTADRDTHVAVAAVGYADGLDLRLSNSGALWFRGARCPIVGLINMDLTLVDVTDLSEPPEPGEDLALLGPEYDAAAMARDIDSTPYEVLTAISRRVERRYPEAG